MCIVGVQNCVVVSESVFHWCWSHLLKSVYQISNYVWAVSFWAKKSSGVENMPAERRDTWKVNSTGLSLAGALLITSCTAFARRNMVGGSLRTWKYQCSSIFVKNWLKFPWCTMMSPLFHKYWLSLMKSYLHAMVPFKLEWTVSISHVLWKTAGFPAWMRKFDLVFYVPHQFWSWDSMVGIAAVYELNGPGAHPASTTHTGAISLGWNGCAMALTTHPLLVSGLRLDTPLPPLHDCIGMIFNFDFCVQTIYIFLNSPLCR